MIRFFVFYIVWHYTTGIKEFFENVKNFIWFIFHLFSIPVLSRTLFKPWKMLKEDSNGNMLDVSNFFGAFIVTFLMRIIGFFIRVTVIVLGFIIFFIFILLCVPAFIIWILLPVIIPFLFVSSIKLFFLGVN